MVHVSNLLLSTDVMSNTNDLFNLNEQSATRRRRNKRSSTWQSISSCLISSVISVILIAGLFYFFGTQIFKIKIVNEQNAINYKNPNNIFRLPNYIQPIQYRLKLYPYLENSTFKGEVLIKLKCLKRTNTVMLHMEMLNLTNLAFSSFNSKNISNYGVEKVFVGDSKITIKIHNYLEEGQEYLLDLHYEGRLSDSLVGFYRSSYLDENLNKRWIATTHLQPNYARRLFPCFDEPKFKSTFIISVARRTNMTVLSNMQLQEIEVMKSNSGWVWDHFAPSKPMPTYLVAVTISDFKSVIVSSKQIGTVVKIWAPKHTIHQISYASRVTSRLIRFFEKYFANKFALNKLDLLVIPNFAKGAMENWGLISFRDNSLLLDEATSTLETKRHVFNVIAHEVAHQWFGNLVSIEWWSELWLIEGFATYLANLAEEEENPAWHSSFFEIQHNILFADSNRHAHPLHVAVTTDFDIEQIFDPIVYDKAACLLKMLASSIGKEKFRKGVIGYIESFKYGKATEEMLWYSLQKFTDFPIYETMITWTAQSGYPLVTVTNLNSSLVRIDQIKFGDNTSTSIWSIPLSYVIGSDIEEKKEFVMNTQSVTLNVSLGTYNWILFNYQQEGFYRVNYDTQNWIQLIKYYKILPLHNRGQLIDDSFQLANHGYIDYNISFQLLHKLSQFENQYEPWKTAINSLEYFENIFMNTEMYGVFKEFVTNLLKYKFNHKDFDVSELDSIILEKLCMLEYKPCVNIALSLYPQIGSEFYERKMPYNLQHTVYCVANNFGSEEIWDEIWNKTLTPGISGMELRTLYLALGCTKKVWRVNSYLSKTLTNEISPQNVRYSWRSLSKNTIGHIVGLDFIENNWSKIKGDQRTNFNLLEIIISEFLQNLSTKSDLTKLLNFYIKNKKDLKSVDTIYKEMLEKIRKKIEWKEKYINVVIKLMEENEKLY